MGKRNEPKIGERALFFIAPKLGRKKYKERLKREAMEDAEKARVTMSGGYAKHGASRTLNSLVGWVVDGGSAEEDIDLQGAVLRQRARDLYAGGGLARSGPSTMTTNVVGWGIQPKPKVDAEVLGMSDDACDEWERKTLREFRLWAENVMCDTERQQNFYEMQKLAFLSKLVSGDVFVLFGQKDNKRTPYKTTIRLLEADRICTPDGQLGESESMETESGGRIVDGVETDREGAVIRYHVANHHPLSEENADTTWVAIDAYGKETGRPNMLHLMTLERPEQKRGIPFVAAQIEQIKQLDRYISSELAANVVSSMLTAFITRESENGMIGMEDAVNEDEKVTDDEMQVELAPGAVYSLNPGEKVQEINPIRNNSAFEGFVSTLFTVIGAGMGIPKEVLIKKYESNYTAARGALLDFWREVRVERTEFINQFCQPVYEEWLAEAVAMGRVDAPGFFEDPAVRQAWCGCMWMGASMGHVDPLKEVKAAAERINLNISTEEQEASEYNGANWLSNIRQRKKELAAKKDMEGTENAEE
ncbi:MAG: phage portal protein [Clostridia bacterium]|nr:phage portal protein [Clostridia bacterium]